jgi:hypothetical protein
MKMMGNILVKCEGSCNLEAITTSTKLRLNGFFHFNYFILYIRAAIVQVLFHWSQYLSLSTDLSRWFFYAPFLLGRYSFTPKDNGQ